VGRISLLKDGRGNGGLSGVAGRATHVWKKKMDAGSRRIENGKAYHRSERGKRFSGR